MLQSCLTISDGSLQKESTMPVPLHPCQLLTLTSIQTLKSPYREIDQVSRVKIAYQDVPTGCNGKSTRAWCYLNGRDLGHRSCRGAVKQSPGRLFLVKSIPLIHVYNSTITSIYFVHTPVYNTLTTFDAGITFPYSGQEGDLHAQLFDNHHLRRGSSGSHRAQRLCVKRLGFEVVALKSVADPGITWAIALGIWQCCRTVR
jgi:hypothetical protein